MEIVRRIQKWRKKETCHTLRSPVIGYLLRGRLTSGSSRAGRRWRIQFVFFHVVIKHFLRFLDRIKDFLPIFAFTQVQARLSTSPPVWNQPSAPRHTVMYTAPKELSRWSIMERRATSFFFQHQTDAIHLREPSASERGKFGLDLFFPSPNKKRKKKLFFVLNFLRVFSSFCSSPGRDGSDGWLLSIWNVIADDDFLVHVSSNFAAGKLRYILSTGLHAATTVTTTKRNDDRGSPERNDIHSNQLNSYFTPRLATVPQ